jgi:hypothetical protein
MDRKTYDVINSVGGYEEFEKLVKRGRQMHDEAVFDLFTHLMSIGVRFVKAHLVFGFRKKDRQNHYRHSYSRYSF